MIFTKQSHNYEQSPEKFKKDSDGLLQSCYTQLYDIEREVNGLYTFDRKPKFNSEIFRKINQQKAAIEK